MPGRAAGPISNTGFRCCASACRGRRRWRTGSTATPRAVSCSGAIRRRCGGSGRLFAEGRSRKCIGRSSAGVPRESRGTHRGRAREADARHGRLAHGGGPGRAARGHRLPRARRGRRGGLARTPAAHRADASDPRALRRARRSRSSAIRSMAARPIIRCSCTRARSRCRSIRQAADRGDGAGAAAHASPR